MPILLPILRPIHQGLLAHLGMRKLFSGAALVVLGAACRHWEPFGNIGAGEGLPPSHEPALGWERGVLPPQGKRLPAFTELDAKITRELADGWKPLAFGIRPEHCYAVALRLGDGGVSDYGPLAEEVRRAKPALVLRAPTGEVVAHTDHALWRCNWEGFPSLTLDLEYSLAPAVTGPLGKGTLEARFFERALTPDERRELDARATPFLAGGGIALGDPDAVRTPKGIRAQVRLEHFEPLPLGALAPGHCDSVSVHLGDDAHLNPAARMFDAQFLFVVRGEAPSFPAFRLVKGELVSDEVCNTSAAPLEVELGLDVRSSAVPPGTGSVTIEAFTRPMQLAARKTPLLAGSGLEPPNDKGFAPEGAPLERKLEAFEPVEVAVRAGRCVAVSVAPTASTEVARDANLYTHYFVLHHRTGGGRPLAQMEENGVVVARPFCFSGGDLTAWRMSFALESRTGAPAGQGAVRVQIYGRAMRPEDY